MPRFYLPPDQCRDTTLFLTGREAHHAVRVLRLRRGDRVTVLDGAGSQFLCAFEQNERDKVKLNVLEKTSIPPLPYRITLLQALPKGKIFESIVQKATELGVFRIVPLLSEHVVAAQVDQKGVQQKAEKWRLVAIEAIKQCGSAWLPEIESPVTPKQFLARREKFELPLIASLQSDSRHPREFFRAFQSEHGRRPGSVCIWVGPEGDFTAEEVASVASAGASAISLGPLVLRTETAAIYCLSVINHELQSPVSAQ
jgi:16S rRNA (uracil1498-N3)-methyltransferase